MSCQPNGLHIVSADDWRLGHSYPQAIRQQYISSKAYLLSSARKSCQFQSYPIQCESNTEEEALQWSAVYEEYVPRVRRRELKEQHSCRMLSYSFIALKIQVSVSMYVDR
jgi:hypothetical protein